MWKWAISKKRIIRAAVGRYEQALGYKPDDAPLNFRVAQCLEKRKQPEEARLHYEEYLKILPHGPRAEAEKALARLRKPK